MSKSYDLVWRGEVVDQCDDYGEACRLVSEYAMAFGSAPVLRKVRNRCAQCDVAISLSADLCKDCWDAGTVEFGP